MPLYILLIILKMTGIKILYFKSVGLHLQKRSREFRYVIKCFVWIRNKYLIPTEIDGNKFKFDNREMKQYSQNNKAI